VHITDVRMSGKKEREQVALLKAQMRKRTILKGKLKCKMG